MIVFARAPRLGTLKRRLAADLGARAALRFQLATLRRLLRRLRADRRFRTVLAATPDAARWPPDPAWRGLPRIPQGRGDLGARMHRAFARFPRARVALVGCDIPAIAAADLAACFRALGQAHAAFGPAEDGGYWLVAMARRRPAHPFADVRWSGPHALADTARNFAGRRVATLRTLRDVDTAADLQEARSGSARTRKGSEDPLIP
ncbi:MAG: TIGR04282 family arsenosugar biosynthesis glycosyltransferase [Janthinobacterium lividum]